MAHSCRSVILLQKSAVSRYIISMKPEEIADLYRALDRDGVAIWIDGGWAVDAVVGHQTRPHNDLDIAVEAKSLPRLEQLLAKRGYRPAPLRDASQWNYVLDDGEGHRIDVHVVVLDEQRGASADPIAGIAYPAGSLTGEGVIAGAKVRCVGPEFLLQFKTSYSPRAIDRQDVAALCGLLGRPVPDTHK
jgi:lincosamide nucleotidyltransferase A/C/D/E